MLILTIDILFIFYYTLKTPIDPVDAFEDDLALGTISSLNQFDERKI